MDVWKGSAFFISGIVISVLIPVGGDVEVSKISMASHTQISTETNVTVRFCCDVGSIFNLSNIGCEPHDFEMSPQFHYKVTKSIFLQS